MIRRAEEAYRKESLARASFALQAGRAPKHVNSRFGPRSSRKMRPIAPWSFAFLALMAVLGAPTTTAGTVDAPEIRDGTNDVETSNRAQPGPRLDASDPTVADGLDLVAVWIDGETNESFQVNWKVVDLSKMTNGRAHDGAAYQLFFQGNWTRFVHFLAWAELVNNEWSYFLNLINGTTGDWGRNIPASGSINDATSTISVVVPKSAAGVPRKGAWLHHLQSTTNCLCPLYPVTQGDSAKAEPADLRFTFRLHTGDLDAPEPGADASDEAQASLPGLSHLTTLAVLASLVLAGRHIFPTANLAPHFAQAKHLGAKNLRSESPRLRPRAPHQPQRRRVRQHD